jgi:hypothetical protein
MRVGGVELTQRCQVQTCSCWLKHDIEFDIKSNDLLANTPIRWARRFEKGAGKV